MLLCEANTINSVLSVAHKETNIKSSAISRFDGDLKLKCLFAATLLTVCSHIDYFRMGMSIAHNRAFHGLETLWTRLGVED